MPDFVVPARENTHAINNTGEVTDIVAWNIDTTPTTTVQPIVLDESFSVDYVVLPSGRRYRYPAWEYDGWGVSTG